MTHKDKLMYVLFMVLSMACVFQFYEFKNFKEQVAIDQKKIIKDQINKELSDFIKYQDLLKKDIEFNQKKYLDSVIYYTDKSEAQYLIFKKSSSKLEKLYEKRNTINLHPDSLPRF